MTRVVDKSLNRLSAVEVKNPGLPGLYHDGGGLYLHVSQTGAKSWLFRYMFEGRARSMGLGSCTSVSLKDARNRAWGWRNVRQDGDDPLAVRDKVDTDSKTLKAFAEEFLAERETGDNPWSSTYQRTWRNTLSAYVYPSLGELQPRQIDLSMVRKIVDPLWKTKTRTANDVRWRIETIIDYAKASDPERDMVGRWRENPARMKGLWDKLQRPVSTVAPVEHYRDLSYEKLPQFIGELTQWDSIAAPPLKLLVLVVARSKMIYAMEWSEVDFNAKVWTVPAERMKNKKTFRIPLSKPALTLLEHQEERREGKYVFPGKFPGTHIARTGMWDMLKLTNWRDETCVHGLRASYSTWAAEETDFAFDIREMVLSHTVGGAAYEAYQHGDLLRKRRIVMDVWGKFVTNAGKVVHLQQRR